jgi:glycosyltransferase involved in cell wall biosynthesis
MNINFIGPINLTSYGYTSFNILKALNDSGHQIALRPVAEKLEVEKQSDWDFVQNLIHNLKDFNYNAPCVRLWHQHDMSWWIGNGPKIGFPIFELETFNSVEKHNLAFCDAIFVPSKWAKGVVEDNLPEKECHVVNLGCDTSVFKPADKDSIHQDDIYRFINVGKLERRKGHDILAAAFAKAFPSQADVRLVMASSSSFSSPEEHKAHQQAYQQVTGGRTDFIPRLPSAADLARGLQQCDCGIFPSLAEGWNLPLLEAMACGKPVIATNYSAHTEFLSDADECKKIEIHSLEPAVDNKFFNGSGKWASFGPDQEEQLIEHMRYMYNNKISYSSANLEQARKFTWKRSADQMVEALKDISTLAPV